MGIRPFPRRTAFRGAVVFAALLPPVPACALGASTARLPGLSLAARTGALTTRVSREVRNIRIALAVRLRALPLILRRCSGPACSLVDDRQEHPEQDRPTARLRAALSAARELLHGLAARRPRSPARPAGPVSGTPAGPGPYERPRGRRRPDARP